MSWFGNFIKNQASSVANALSYGLTHLDQVSTAGDIIVVQHPDGTLHSTPFNVRFGIFSVPRPQTKVVQIQVNGQMVSAVMKLRSDGSAYFLESAGAGSRGGGSGDFPVSPTTGTISPPRSPTLQAASPLTMMTAQQNNNQNNNSAAATATTINNDINTQEIAPVVVDEGSAVEIAKNNPEFRDLVTSMLGEGRETALQESFAAGMGNSFAAGRPAGHARIYSTSGINNNNTIVSPSVDEGISPVQRQATEQDGSGFATSNNGTSPSSNENNNNNNNNIPHVTFANDTPSNNNSVGLPTPVAGGGKSFASSSGGLRLSRFASSDNVAALNNLIANDDEFAAIVKEIGQQQQQALQLASSSCARTSLGGGGGSDETLNNNNSSPSQQSSPSLVVANNNNNNNATPEMVSHGQQAESPDFRNKNQQQQQHQLLPPSQVQQQQQHAFLLPPEQAGSQIIDDGEFVDDSSDDDYDYFYQPAVAPTTTTKTSASPTTVAKQGNNSSPQLGVQQQQGGGATTSTTSTNGSDEIENTSNNLLEGTTTEQQEFLKKSLSSSANNTTTNSNNNNHPHHVHATTTPSHNELVKLGLNDGANIVKFIVYSTTLTRSIEVEARIFLWPYTAKVIISDIDGTVTKSDVMGHLSAILRWDWTHPGLCSLYTNIAKNEYKFLYLTARSLSQTSSTRNFLESIVQDGQRLPDGPVFTAPEKLFAALTQEVFKRSHIFKTNCLKEVRDIFPKSLRHPLYAGFGNRIGDSIAYEAVGIPLHKIFIIDESSVVHVCKVKQTYRDLAHLVDMTFPPISGKIPVHASQLPIRYTDVVVKHGGVTYARSDSPLSSIGATAGSVASLTNTLNNNNSNTNNNNAPTSPTLSSSGAGARISSPHVISSSNRVNSGLFPSNAVVTTNEPSHNNNLSSRSPSGEKNNFVVGLTTIGGSGNPIAPPLFVQNSNNNNNNISSSNNNNNNNSCEDEMMEEKVDFNEFNYWRVDPSSLVSTTKTVPATTNNNTTAVTSPGRPVNSSAVKGNTHMTLSDIPTTTNNNSNNNSTTPRSDNSQHSISSTTTTGANNNNNQQPQTAPSDGLAPQQQQSAGWFGGWFSRGGANKDNNAKPTSAEQHHQNAEDQHQQQPQQQSLEKGSSSLSDKK